jgi:hypothetical protein
MSLRRRQYVDLVPAPIRHLLVEGCWLGDAPPGGGALEAFLIGGELLRENTAGLRAAWGQYGEFVKLDHPASTFAERVLGGASVELGPCPTHAREREMG